MTIGNTSSAAINGWTLVFTFGSDQKVTAGWSGTWTQSGQTVTARDAGYNGTIAAGSSTSTGFNGTWTTSNPTPTAFTLNGTACTIV
jgi:hypothetical protein